MKLKISENADLNCFYFLGKLYEYLGLVLDNFPDILLSLGSMQKVIWFFVKISPTTEPIEVSIDPGMVLGCYFYNLI